MNRTSKLLALLCAAALTASLAGCSFFKGGKAASSSGSSLYGSVADYDYETFSYSDGLDENGCWDGIRALDYVTLPEDVAAIAVPRAEVMPSEEEVQAQIDSLLSQNAATAEVTNRAAADGDTVNIDYSGTVDGVAFTGGTASGYDLTLGSGSFIDNFEEQIVGHNPNETFDVNVTFPEGYGDTTDANGNTVSLGGKAAVFSVTLNYIEETVLPQLTDEWVENSFGESRDLHTVEELRADYEKQLYEENLTEYLINYLMENSTFSELPKAVTDYQVKQCLNYYNTMAGYYGYSLNDFLTSLVGYSSADELLDDMSDDFTLYAKEALLYQAVAEQLSITPTQEQLDLYSAYYDYYGANYCRMVSLTNAVRTTLCENAKVA